MKYLLRYRLVFSGLRSAALPLALVLVFLAQTQRPDMLPRFALWSNRLFDPLQFFTYAFLSGNGVHLAVNALALGAIHYGFACGYRLPVLLIMYVLLAAGAGCAYFHLGMPAGAALMGASGGAYALLGLATADDPRAWVSLFGLRRLTLPIWVAMPGLLLIEILVAHFWLPTLAWGLHVSGFALGLAVMVGIRVTQAAAQSLVGHNTWPSRLLEGLRPVTVDIGGAGAPPRGMGILPMGHGLEARATYTSPMQGDKE